MDQRRVETVPKVSREVVSGAFEKAYVISPSGVLSRMSHSAREESFSVSGTG